MQSTYLTSAQKANQLPSYELPEIAFIGRSNCGKSSLLNTLLGRKNLARSSSTPGRTQMVNFFSLQMSGQRKMIFADLPGYGFNVARQEVRNFWDLLLKTYLTRENICEFLYLIDIRRSFDEDELAYMRQLGNELPLIVVLTKADKVTRSQAHVKKERLSLLLEEAEVRHKRIVIVSNLKKTGISQLQEIIFAHGQSESVAAPFITGPEAPFGAAH